MNKALLYQTRKACRSYVLFICCFALWSCSTDYVKEIDKAIEKHDFQSAHDFLKELKEQPAALWERAEARKVYFTEFNKIMQAEITYLVNEKDQQSSDRLIGLINEYPIDSNPAVGTTHDSDIIEGNDNYNAEVGKFNDYCNQILSRAISTKNQYLADAIINTYKPTLARKKVDTHLFGNDEYDYQYVETDKEKAKEILKEAVKDKKFN